MKINLKNRLLDRTSTIAASFFALASASSLSAADQTWDNGASNSTWDTSATNWDGGVAWTDNNNAIFGTTGAGALTVNGTVSVGTLSLTSTSNGDYSFTGGTIQHTANDWTFNKGATISSAITATLGGSQNVNVNTTNNADAGKLTITGAVSMSGTGTGNFFKPDGRVSFKDNTVTLTNVTFKAGFSNGATYGFDNSTVTITSESTSGERGIRLAAGTINVTNSTITAPIVRIGNGGSGTLTMTSGSFTTGEMEFNPYNGTSTSTLNLNGGTTAVTQLTQLPHNPSGGATTVNLNFNGGVLKALANNTNFINISQAGGATTNAKVMTGGAKIDTNGFDITIPVPLVSGTAGDGGLLKSGTGTLTLSGTSTYTGATTVSAGTLLVSGALGSNVSISDNATLSGSGTVGALSFAGGAFFDIFLAISNPLDATSISFSASGFGIDNLLSQSSAVDWSAIADGTYTLINGTLTDTNLGNFGLANAYDLGGGRSAYFNNGSLQLVVIPEPSVTTLLGGLGAMLLLRRRR